MSIMERSLSCNDYDREEDNDSIDLDDDQELNDLISDEDTEDASETDQAKQEEFSEIKEQMYHQKLVQLRRQLSQLKDGTLPEYIKKFKRIEQQYYERLRINNIWYEFEHDNVENNYIEEQKEAAKEFEEKKIELKENLILELEEKKRSIDNERVHTELTGDFIENKPVSTRKLRRRPNDPNPLPEKRKRASPAQLNYCLSEDEILEDLKIINKVSGKPINRKPLPSQIISNGAPTYEILFDARIDDGKLHYDKKWYHKGQTVFVDSKETGKVGAIISVIGTQEIWLRRTSDNGKLKVHISQLQKGKYSIRKRPS